MRTVDIPNPPQVAPGWAARGPFDGNLLDLYVAIAIVVTSPSAGSRTAGRPTTSARTTGWAARTSRARQPIARSTRRPRWRRLATAVHGPRSELFVDRVLCRLLVP